VFNQHSQYTLVELAKRTNNGNLLEIAEVLSITKEMFQDAVWIEANQTASNGGKEVKIIVNEISGIEPIFTQPGNPSVLRINIKLSDCQAKDIFYSIWGYYGNEKLKKWLELEGWEIRIRESLCDQEEVW
ncbi:MAG: hypothetical protein LLG05_13035, partial [Porphyromonadaceae bacterium]|nr:hypothetical protein [Porphyromonadaceae bacterium]